MIVAVASDHAGFAYKEKIREYLTSKGYEVTDFGAFNAERSDYPDYGHLAAAAIASGAAERGVFVCGSGIGIAIVANRHRGVRAVDAVTMEMAQMARAHNNANVLALGERMIAWEEATKIIDVFFATDFEGGRHEVRVEKIEVK